MSPVPTPTPSPTQSYGAGLWIILGVYFVGIFGIAMYAYFKNRQQIKNNQGSVVNQHYLAGNGLGSIVLMFSFVASLYSGYAMVGLPGEAYEKGFVSTRWACSALSIALAGATFMPMFMRLGRTCGYVSCMDMLYDRYGNKPLLHGAVLCTVAIPVFLYMVAQFKAFGGTIEALSGDKIPDWVAAIVLALMLLFYETFGGLTAVALTDVIQGAVLILGSCMFFIFVGVIFDGLPTIGEQLVQKYDDKIAVPSIEEKLKWLGWVVQGFAYPMYPHFMSRVFAAKDTVALQKSLYLTTISPFIVLLPASLLGIAAIPNIVGAQNSEVFGDTMGLVISQGAGWYLMGSIIIAASVAAIMSTSDSLLIGLSHLICLDVFRVLRPKTTENQLLWAGKIISVVAATSAVIFSTFPLNLSIVLSMQNAILVQTLPTYVVGMIFKGLHWSAVFIGLVVGVVIVVLFTILDYVAPILWASAANIFLVFFIHFVMVRMAPWDYRDASLSGQYKVSCMDIEHLVTPDMILGHPVIFCILLFLAFITVPFWAPEGSETAKSLIGGMPVWAFLSYLFLGLGVAALLVSIWKWWPSDESLCGGGETGTKSGADLEELLLDEEKEDDLPNGDIEPITLTENGTKSLESEEKMSPE